MNGEELDNTDNQQKKKTISYDPPTAFKMQFEKLINEYITLKDAFVSTDEKRAEGAAQKTLETLNKVDMKLLSGEAHHFWMGLQKPMTENLQGIIQMKGIEMKRKHFSTVSDNLYKAIEVFGNPNNEPLYYQYCPMAFDDQGAYWISGDKQIRNPYFGDLMLKCGEVREEL